MQQTNELPISQPQEIIYLEYRPLHTENEDDRKSANMNTTEVNINNFYLPLSVTLLLT